MRRSVKFYEAPVVVTRSDVWGALGIVASLVLVIGILISSFAGPLPRLALKADLGLSEIAELGH